LLLIFRGRIDKRNPQKWLTSGNIGSSILLLSIILLSKKDCGKNKKGGAA